MKILAIDLGKFKSMGCIYFTEGCETRFIEVATQPVMFHDLIVEHAPDRIVIEVGSQAGWVCDLAEALGVEIQVADPNHEAWRWKNNKRKTDRDDALKLAQLSHLDQLPTVHVPAAKTRQWRSLIAYRHTLVGRRTAIKNSIRAILDRQGLSWPSGRAGWTQKTLAALGAFMLPIEAAEGDELWKAQVDLEREALEQVESLIARVEAKLDALAQADGRVQRLRTIPGVGPRLAELVVAVIDDPHRFTNAKQVGAYAGLVPRQYESGMMSRQGRITGRGNPLLRALLVEVAWLMRSYNGWFRQVFDKVCRGSQSRRKIAAVATARRILVCCWAMLRNETDWCEPAI
mgnify:CR=1 FL=1